VTRPAGQVRVRDALTGLVLAGAVAVAVVWLCQALLLPVETVPRLDAPAGDEPIDCPERLPAEPVEVDAASLIFCPDHYDGVVVEYLGEVVAAVLDRGERAWVHLNDDAYGTAGPLPEHRTTLGGNSGVPVTIPARSAAAIEFIGGHRAAGDTLRVTGEFRRSHPEDGGGPAIHADDVERFGSGRPIERSTPPVRVVAALVLAAAATGAALLARRARTVR
jgi:hypothetical protein